jgi:hypothetical protein
VKNQAAAHRMLPRLAKFIVGEGQRRKLEAAFAAAFTSFQNQEPADVILENVLNSTELALDQRFDMPDADENGMHDRLDAMFGRWFAGDDPLEIVVHYRRVEATA